MTGIGLNERHQFLRHPVLTKNKKANYFNPNRDGLSFLLSYSLNSNKSIVLSFGK